jgi:hypothetical protein
MDLERMIKNNKHYSEMKEPKIFDQKYLETPQKTHQESLKTKPIKKVDTRI